MISQAFKLVALLLISGSAWAFDHSHAEFSGVLKEHVRWNKKGTESTVNYAALKADSGPLKRYLQQLSAVERETFQSWNQDQQLAFLINAYNAFTLQLILDNYPLGSIRNIGRFWQNPWKMRFFTLLEEDMHLDQLEHEIIREPGVYDEPRIHFAVNCASIGCPALRTEPFTAEQLEKQLQDSAQRFLRDQTRNRFNNGRMEISSIFRWYSEDFERGWQGTHSVAEFLALYQEALGLSDEQAQELAAGKIRIRHLDYDWALNE